MPELAYISFEQNGTNAVEVSVATLTTQTWQNTTVVHVLRGNYPVGANQTLTIAPGMKLKGYDADLNVSAGDSKLLMAGTEAAPIVVTSLADDTVCGVGALNEPVCDTNSDGAATAPARGSTHCLGFVGGVDAASVVRRVAFRYTGLPILVSDVVPAIDHISFFKSAPAGISLTSGTWKSHSLRETSTVYHLDGNLSLAAEATLRIDPGVKVKGSSYSAITLSAANSTLLAEGTETDPIVFTSEKDDTVCGVGAANEAVCDTNADGGETAPAAGQWSGLTFSAVSSSNSVLSRVNIRYAGYGSGAAVRLNNASPSLSYVNFRRNTRGLDVLDGAQPSLFCNDFERNTEMGIKNNRPATTVFAQGQWWDHPSGPTHATNPAGKGDKVSDGVNFSSWATAPCTHGEEARAWTFMFYLDGEARGLEDNYKGIFNQLESVADNPNVNLIVLWDPPGRGNSAYYHIKYDTDQARFANYTEGEDKWSAGEVNMGQPNAHRLCDLVPADLPLAVHGAVPCGSRHGAQRHAAGYHGRGQMDDRARVG